MSVSFLIAPAVTEYLPEPAPATGRPRDPPHGHRHHRHRSGSLFQVSTIFHLSSLHVFDLSLLCLE